MSVFLSHLGDLPDDIKDRLEAIIKKINDELGDKSVPAEDIGRTSNESTEVEVPDEMPAVTETWWLESSPFADAATPEPPKKGERILLMLLSKEDRENMIGDLAEEFASITARHGMRFARVWYWRQVAGSAWPLLRKALRWGLLASAWDIVRRFI
jgi:hypothetical protein